jgi:DNA replicative helicase MCM subunit Mcm2 (Cdc46/Mcm family)
LVRDVADVWRAFFLASASSYAPPILANGSEQRAQIHLFLLGDPSTAKSRLLKEFSKLNPKCRIANDITYAGFVGTVQKGITVKGECAELDRGMLCIDEFEKFYGNHYRKIDGALRSVMEDSHIRRRLALGTVDDDTRTCILAVANPINDVFEDKGLKVQTPIPYGLLTRFDYFRPIAYTQHKIAEVGKFMANIWFKPAKLEDGYLNQDKVRSILIELRKAWESSGAYRVEVAEAITKRVEQAWEQHLDRWDARASKGIPLLTNRDLASLYRFLNASAVLHIKQRQVVDGTVIATEDDADNAIWILDQLALWRREYLTQEGKRSRIAESPTEKVQRVVDRIVAQNVKLESEPLAHSLMNQYDVSRRTAYYWIKDWNVQSQSP